MMPRKGESSVERVAVGYGKRGSKRMELLNKYRVLTEYECGRAQLAIEWVSRSQKPIAEIGGRPLGSCDLDDLVCDLEQCIAASGEDVLGFVIPDGNPEYCSFGFYRYSWALEALLMIWGPKDQPPSPACFDWLHGLLFGYDAAAIERFIRSSSCERESKTPHVHCMSRRVGIYALQE